MQPFGASGHSRFSPFLLNATDRSAYGEDTTIWAELVQRLEERLTSALSASSPLWCNMPPDVRYPIQQHPSNTQQQQHPSATHQQRQPAAGETASGTTLRVQSNSRIISASSSGSSSDDNSSNSSSSLPPVEVFGTAADTIKPATLPVLRPDATRLRTHSWIVNHSDSMDDDAISPALSSPDGADGKRLNVTPRTPYARVPTETAFEMAYFLKNTGPNLPKTGEAGSDGTAGKRKTRHRSVFKILGGTKGRKSLAERVGTVEHNPEKDTLTIFVPPEGVVQKVSSNGKKYLQIVTGNEPAGSQPFQLASPRSNEPWKKRTSATLPEQFSSLGTDTFDTWLSTLGIQNLDQVSEINHEAPPEVLKEEAKEKTTLRESSSAPALETASSAAPKKASVVDEVNESRVEASDGKSSEMGGALLNTPPTTPEPREAISSSASPTGSGRRDIDDLPSQRRLRERSASVPLAGMGLRRPSKERTPPVQTDSPTSTEDANGHNRVDSLMNRSDTVSSSDGTELRGRSVDLTRTGSREDKIRARKLRDLQRTRGIDAIVRKPLPSERLELEEADRAAATTCDHLERAKRIQQRRIEKAVEGVSDEGPRPASLQSTPPTNAPVPTPTSTTGYTPVSGTMMISPVVTVAEQRPLPRANKDVTRPARLVLREARRSSRPSAIAYRSDPARFSRDDSGLALASERYNRTTRDELGFGRGGPRPRRASSLKFVPGAADAATGSRASHGTLRTPSAMSVATSLGMSSETSRGGNANAKMRSLEARVEALERQNRLLEAALQAVLRTSAEIKTARCGCEGREGEREERREEGREGRGWSGGSALDIWLETRLGRGSEGSGGLSE